MLLPRTVSRAVVLVDVMSATHHQVGPSNHLSIGVDASYIFGQLNQNDIIQASANGVTLVSTTNNTNLQNMYFTYGMHWCCNAVCGETRDGTAVLIRALHPLTGLTQMSAVRPRARSDCDLCNGPAKLTQALGISGEHDGTPLFRKRGLFAIVDDGTAPPRNVKGFPRVGISRGVEHPWRWYVPDNRHVSKA